MRKLLSYATSPTGIYLLSSVLAKAGVLALVPLYTRKLTVEEFGDYALAQSLAQVGPVFLSLGTMAAVSTFYFAVADLDASQRKSGGAARVSIVLTTTLAIVTQLGIVMFGASGHGLGSRHALSCVLWGGVGTFFGGIPTVYFKAQQRPLAAAGFQLFQFLVTVTAAYWLVVSLQRGLAGAIEAIALSGVAIGLLGIGFVYAAMPGALGIAIWRESIRFSLPFVPHFASMQITSLSDRWVMKGAGDNFDVGAYSLAVTVTGPIGMVSAAWNEAESPKMGETVRRGGRRAVAKGFPRVLVEYAMSAVLPGIALLASVPLLKLIVGQRFAHALWPIPIMILLLVLDSPFSPAINVFSFLHRTRLIPVITMSSALFHLAVNLLLIPKWGISGALMARGLTCLVRSSTLIFFALQTLRMPNASDQPRAAAPP